MAKLRITVVRKATHWDLLEEHFNREVFPQAYGPCGLWEEGAEYVVDGVFPRMPEDFPCEGAWLDMQRYLYLLMWGGNAPWIKQQGVVVASCSDGLRPVSFKIERLE